MATSLLLSTTAAHLANPKFTPLSLHPFRRLRSSIPAAQIRTASTIGETEEEEEEEEVIVGEDSASFELGEQKCGLMRGQGSDRGPDKLLSEAPLGRIIHKDPGAVYHKIEHMTMMRQIEMMQTCIA
ncbi:hypothetical protein AKJ16_DCAP19873 [Drosera capensis]